MVIKQEFTFPSSDGVHTVAAAWWRPEGPPRGVVQLVHGISEHIGRYDSFARFLAEHGFAVVGHDHLGHGRTARNPLEFGWFADRDGWKHVVKDVRALRERVGAEYPGLPCFLLGHSMGSFVVRGYLMFWPGTVDGAILSGTGQEPPATVAAGRALSALLIRLKGPRATAPCWTPSLWGGTTASLSPSAPRRTGSPGTRWWWTPTGPIPCAASFPPWACTTT